MDRNVLPELYKLVRLLYLYNNKIRDPLQIADELNRIIKQADVEISETDVLAALAYGTLCEDCFQFDIQIRYRTPLSRRKSLAKSVLLKDMNYQLVLLPSSAIQIK